ncbi:MAG: bifunctional riboflavin kinase/FAD synthetase [Clostridiales Family XIII bacterium]|jgi:riboflavin kinase/FMN adenylyltransferase|nr:bifunctional riboflavin kinase/FAD synthetase [Clostridiales Family XIII bacterium]
MKIFDNIENIDNIQPTAIALGNFDGFHRGHVALIRRTIEVAQLNGLKSAIFTFANHPRNVIAGRSVVKHIMYPQDKLWAFEKLGLDYVFSLPFDEFFHHMDATTFIKDYVLGKFNAEEILCGFNFHFGKGATGNAEALAKLADSEGFELELIEPVMVGDELVSSTTIRRYIHDGKMEHAATLLGRAFYIKGEVIHGNAIGRTIGFPTANIILDQSMVQPAHGVYTARVRVDNQIYNAVTNVGVRPTIGDEHKLIESHILDFDGDLYGKEMKVELLKHLRGEMKFASLEELAASIDADKKVAEEYFKV